MGARNGLLLRMILLQAVLCGFIGYGLGVFAVWLVRFMREKDSSPPAPRWAWMVLVPVGLAGMVLMAIWFHVCPLRLKSAPPAMWMR